jgi:hypothetical protein
VEQRNIAQCERSASRNAAGAIDLKALARAVLDRNAQRNASGAEAQNRCSAPAPRNEPGGTPVPGSVAVVHAASESFDEERAPIIEEGSGCPREWAEGFAQLDAAHPPGDIPSARWRQFIDDAGRFLDHGWAARAKALGWSPLELFGCDRPRPLARTDNTGLVWMLRGRRLLALTAEMATVENKNAPPHKYRRCINEPDRAALAWELVP